MGPPLYKGMGGKEANSGITSFKDTRLLKFLFNTTSIETVVVGTSVQRIEKYAFLYCSSLKNVEFEKKQN